MPSSHEKTKPAQIKSRQMFVSIVVPIRNEAEFISNTLDSLLAQDYPQASFEIIVVDGYSTDNTCSIVESYVAKSPNVTLHKNPKRWSSAARNIGIRESHGDVIVIVDGHCDIPNGLFLRNLVSAFEGSGADIVGRPQPLNVECANRTQRAIALARASRVGHHPDSFVYDDTPQFVPASSVGTAYRREVFDRIGLFDETFDACEDVELNTRADAAGERCFFTSDVGIRYYPRTNLRGLFRQMARYGRGRVRLSRKHPETTSVKSLVPGVFVAGLVVGSMMAWLHPLLATIFMAAIVTYVLIVGIASISIVLRKRAFGLIWLLPLVFLTIHVGAGWGILREMIQGGWR